MQRRVAAGYFAFFLVLAASGFTVITLAHPPQVDAPGPRVSSGSTLDVGGETYHVRNVSVQQVGGGHGGTEPAYFGRIEWTVENADYTGTLSNNSTVDGLLLEWPDMAGRYSATLTEGDTVRYQGNRTTVVVYESNVTLRAGENASSSFAVGETLRYRANETTVAAISGDTVTLRWANSYRVRIRNVSDPDRFTFRQEYNVTALLRTDPAVENETVTRADERRYVVYEANGSTALLEDYLPDSERQVFAEGDTFGYKANRTTVANVTSKTVTLTWTAPRSHSVSLAQDSTVSVGGQTFTAYYLDDDTVLLASDFQAYQTDLRRIAFYNERINGLWGVVDLGLLAAILVVAAAYMPVRG